MLNDENIDALDSGARRPVDARRQRPSSTPRSARPGRGRLGVGKGLESLGERARARRATGDARADVATESRRARRRWRDERDEDEDDEDDEDDARRRRRDRAIRDDVTGDGERAKPKPTDSGKDVRREGIGVGSRRRAIANGESVRGIVEASRHGARGGAVHARERGGRIERQGGERGGDVSRGREHARTATEASAGVANHAQTFRRVIRWVSALEARRGVRAGDQDGALRVEAVHSQSSS